MGCGGTYGINFTSRTDPRIEEIELRVRSDGFTVGDLVRDSVAGIGGLDGSPPDEIEVSWLTEGKRYKKKLQTPEMPRGVRGVIQVEFLGGDQVRASFVKSGYQGG